MIKISKLNNLIAKIILSKLDFNFWFYFGGMCCWEGIIEVYIRFKSLRTRECYQCANIWNRFSVEKPNNRNFSRVSNKVFRVFDDDLSGKVLGSSRGEAIRSSFCGVKRNVHFPNSQAHSLKVVEYGPWVDTRVCR